MEFKVPERDILRRTLSTDMVEQVWQWERKMKCYSRKRQGPVTEEWCNHNLFCKIVFWGEREDEDKRKQQT